MTRIPGQGQDREGEGSSMNQCGNCEECLFKGVCEDSEEEST
jgi:hypothetical protein